MGVEFTVFGCEISGFGSGHKLKLRVIPNSVCVYVHMYTYISIYMYMNECINIYIYILLQIIHEKYTYKTRIPPREGFDGICNGKEAEVGIGGGYIYIHVYTYTYTYTYTYIYIHIHRYCTSPQVCRPSSTLSPENPYPQMLVA